MTSRGLKHVYLISGAAGAGKTTVAGALAHDLGAGWLQADTIWRALQGVLQPGSSERDALDVDEAIRGGEKPVDAIVTQHIAASRIVCRGLERAIAFELRATYDTLVVDGAWLDPAWMASLRFLRDESDGQVRSLASFDPDVEVDARCVVIHEPAAGEVKRAMRQRWSTISGQVRATLPRERLGAEVSWLYGNWLRDEAAEHGLPIITARPRETLHERSRTALDIG
ncbi:MAG: AAA family ATPase [Tepidiformaceae bacterium]